MNKVILTGLVALGLCSCDHPKPASSGSGNSAAQTVTAQVVSHAEPPLSALEMSKAFVVAFGQPAPAVVTVTSDPSSPGYMQVYEFNPETLFQISPGLFVLVSDGFNREDCHACTGHLAIHYLTVEKGEYKTLGRWLNVGGEAPYGRTASWAIRYDVEPNPVIWTTTEDGGQGCELTSHDIISLLPARAVTSAQGIVTKITFDGGGDGKPWKTEGKLVSGNDQKSFSIKYTGKYNKTDHYEKYQDKYIQVGVSDSAESSGISC